MTGSAEVLKLRTIRLFLTRVIFVAAWIPAAWLVFLWTHEAGHVIAALFTGGKIQQVVLHPFVFSRTDVLPNPSPMIVAWGGAALGPLVAGVALWVLRRLPKHGTMLYQSLLGFVLIANGIYIGLGVVQPVGDASDMLRLGTARWILGVYGLCVCGLGIGLWGGVRPFRFFCLNGKRSDWLTIGTLAGIVLTLGIAGLVCCPA